MASGFVYVSQSIVQTKPLKFVFIIISLFCERDQTQTTRTVYTKCKLEHMCLCGDSKSVILENACSTAPVTKHSVD